MRTWVLLALVGVALAAGRQCDADEAFSLVIDPFTGAASLRNDGPAPVALDSYLVTSPGQPVFDTVGWSSLEDNAASGWREIASATGDRIGELNLFESQTIGPGELVGIGSPYTAFAPTDFGLLEPGLRSMRFSYTLVGENESRTGDVEFSARNTVVLLVDAATGEASLQNQSGFEVAVDSYLVKSIPSVLSVEGWVPLSAGDVAWASAPGASNRIAEGNLLGSSPLAANGGALPIGQAINPAILDDERDIELQFSVDGLGTFTGGVLFSGVPSPPQANADFDDDGDVDQDDLTVWEAGYGGPGDLSMGDATGNAHVGGEDFLTWQRQFTGSAAPLSVGGAGAVPEPSSLVLSIAIAAAGLGATRRGRASATTPTKSARQPR